MTDRIETDKLLEKILGKRQVWFDRKDVQKIVDALYSDSQPQDLLLADEEIYCELGLMLTSNCFLEDDVRMARAKSLIRKELAKAEPLIRASVYKEIKKWVDETFTDGITKAEMLATNTWQEKFSGQSPKEER